jgi:hypothetical protein
MRGGLLDQSKLELVQGKRLFPFGVISNPFLMIAAIAEM